MQLPPVGRRFSDDEHNDGKSKQFIFQSKLFPKVFNKNNIIMLKVIFRQTDQPEFLNALNEIRVGKISQSTINFLKKLKQKDLQAINGILPTMLYTTNKDVEKENNYHLEQLTTESHFFKTETIDLNRNMSFGLLKQLTKIIENQIPESLELKIGAQVILTKNIDKYHVNGSRGIIIGFKTFSRLEIDEWKKPRFKAFSPSWLYNIEIPQVRFIDGSTAYMPPCVFRIRGPKVSGVQTELWRMGFPLKLAWAITVHKVSFNFH